MRTVPPIAADAKKASHALSTRTSCTRRHRPAPIETRSAISRARAAACAVIRLATLAQAISSTSATRTPRAASARLVVLLQSGGAGGSRFHQDLIVEDVVAESPATGRFQPFSALRFECLANGVRASGGAVRAATPGCRTHQSADPGRVGAGDAGVHHRGHEDVDEGAGLGAGELRSRRRRRSGRVVCRCESVRPIDMRIAREAAGPIVVGEDGVRMRAGRAIVIRR